MIKLLLFVVEVLIGVLMSNFVCQYFTMKFPTKENWRDDSHIFLVSVDVIIDSDCQPKRTCIINKLKSANDSCKTQNFVIGRIPSVDCVSSALVVLCVWNQIKPDQNQRRWAVLRAHQRWHFLRIQHTKQNLLTKNPTGARNDPTNYSINSLTLSV